MAAFSYWEMDLVPPPSEQGEEEEKRKRPTPSIRHATPSRRRPASAFAAAAVDLAGAAADRETVAGVPTTSGHAASTQETVATASAVDPLPSAPTQDNTKKRRLTSSCCRRRKVEKCYSGPVDPDANPVKLTMKDLIRLAEAKEKSKEVATKKPREETEHGGLSNIENIDQSQENEGATFAPQVQIVNGQIVINQESLTVPSRSRSDVNNFTRVEETHSRLNYHSYLKRTPRIKWRDEDTKLFYKALEQFGTNFELIQAIFPGKTRRQILLKFKSEEKKNPLILTDAMTHRPEDYVHYEKIISRLNLTMEMSEPSNSVYSASVIGQHTTFENLNHEASAPENSEVNKEFSTGVQDCEAEKLEESKDLKMEIPAQASTLHHVKHATASDHAASKDTSVVSCDNESVESFKYAHSHSEPPSASEPRKQQRSKCLFGYQLS